VEKTTHTKNAHKNRPKTDGRQHPEQTPTPTRERAKNGKTNAKNGTTAKTSQGARGRGGEGARGRKFLFSTKTDTLKNP
jgi:hypothetical protein